MIIEKESEIEYILKLLDEVKDPEIPVLSIVDLGIVENIEVSDDIIFIGLLPTYNGCPAMDIIQLLVREKLYDSGYRNIKLELLRHPHWTTDRITENGMMAIRSYGMAAPDVSTRISEMIDGQSHLRCPKCDSDHTSLISAFGSTACKAMFRCEACREPFEYFKCNGVRL
jgi:ring-1,2-phenylacetyl-CoA epoxidase subunit PaaD